MGDIARLVYNIERAGAELCRAFLYLTQGGMESEEAEEWFADYERNMEIILTIIREFRT